MDGVSGATDERENFGVEWLIDGENVSKKREQEKGSTAVVERFVIVGRGIRCLDLQLSDKY